MKTIGRKGGSIRRQLVVWNVLAISLLLGVLGIVSRYVMLSFMMQSVDRELDRGIQMFRRPPRGGPGPFGAPGSGPQFPRNQPMSDQAPNGQFDRGGAPPGQPPVPGGPGFGPGPGPAGPGPGRAPDALNPYRPILITPEGKPWQTQDTREPWDRNAVAAALEGRRVYTSRTVGDEPLRILSAPAFNPDRRMGAVQYAYPLKDVYLALAGIDTALLVLLPVGLLAAGWMGWALTGRILARVNQMTQAAGRIGAEDRAERLPVAGNDEFARLADTFNGLLGRLDSAFQEQKRLLDSQRRFTADASHELKTPLTIIQGSSGLALSRASTDTASRETFGEIKQASETMAKLVQDLLLLARSDEGKLGQDRVEMLAGEVLGRAAALARSPLGAEVSICVEPENLTFFGNEAEVIRLFRNLFENAIRHTPESGSIRARATLDAGAVVVRVTDSGSGIAREHLEHLGERFYRVDEARARAEGGTGLGLSICKSIAEAHGGAVSIESEVRKGTTVTVVIPR